MARTQAATLEALPARDVVDEVSTNRRLLGRLLKNRGHTHVEAKDGNNAIEKIRSAAKTE